MERLEAVGERVEELRGSIWTPYLSALAPKPMPRMDLEPEGSYEQVLRPRSTVCDGDKLTKSTAPVSLEVGL